MKHSTLRLVSVLVLLVAGACAKEQGTSKSDDTTAEAAAKPAAAAVKAAEAPAPKAAEAATAAKTDEMSCNGAKMAEDATDCSQEAAEGGKGCNTWDDAAAEVLKKDIPTNATWQSFRVSGMKCGGCERRVIAKLGEIDGVVGVEADAELGQVRFATLPDASKVAETARAKLDGLYKIEKKL